MGLSGHFEAVLIGARLEPHFATAKTLEPRDDIRRNGLIGVANMRAAIGIADGRGDVLRGGFALSHGLAR